MATANLYCTFILLLYLQGNYAQQGLTNNPNVGINNAIGFQQQAIQRTNAPNNINQMPNGGLNINLPQQSNMQQGNSQQPISSNLQGNMQQSLSLPANLQTPGASGPLANMQFNQQGLAQLPPGFVINPSKLQTISTQFNNAGVIQTTQNNQQQNMASVSNVPTSQTQNAPLSSNSLAELAAAKGHQSLLSLFGSQNTVQPQQTQQMTMPNFNPVQNQLTDVQKQYLVRALQSQSCGQNQPSSNVQAQVRPVGGKNQPAIAIQGQPVPPQQAQAIVTPISNNQPAYITVQAQPLTSYLQSQKPPLEEPSIMSLILSELQPPDSQYNMYPPYPVQKKGSNLKTLIPLIINLLKEKNGCGCHNCGCPNNGCGNNNMPEPNTGNPVILSGYSNQKIYGTGETSKKTNDVEDVKNKSNLKDRKNAKKNSVNVDSEEVSEENDSEYVDDSEGD